MENQPPQNPQMNKPQPAVPPQSGTQQTGPAQGAAKPTVVAALPKSQTKSSRRFVIGCLSAFGCSLFLFLGVLFAFLAFGSSTNPIFGFLGVAPGEVVNVLITLVNLIFLVLVFASFIFVVIGIFKITTAKKDDKDAKRKGAFFTFGSLAIMLFLIFVWIFAYFFLAQKRTVSPTVSIATDPARTINLTAPISIKFDGSKAPINKNTFDILGYSWDFGDKSTATGNPQTHTYYDIGNFTVKMGVLVKEKATAKEQTVDFTRDVTIQNALPKVVITANKLFKDRKENASPPLSVTFDALKSISPPELKGFTPLMVAFDATATSAPNGEISDFSWDLDGDGTYNENDSTVFGKTQWTYADAGTYKVGLQVTDSHGAVVKNDAALTITVASSDSPIAVMKIQDFEGTELETNKGYLFSGADSTTPNGQITAYEWDFGDSGKATTRSATHIYKTAGEYDVTLKVTDSNKKSGTVTQHFTVKGAAAPPLPGLKTTPEAVNGIVSGQAPFSVIFDASASTDPNNDIIEYGWDFNGDGKTDDANAITSHTFATPGSYNVSLTVSDATNLGAKSQIVVKVDPPALKADLSSDTVAGVVPLTVHFDASGSSDPSGKIVNYQWEFGDGGQPRIDTAKVAHQYTQVGTFTAKVTVITAENKRATTQLLINVRPVPVSACFEASALSGKAPLSTEFDPTCSTGTVVKYHWNFGNLSQSADRKPTFTFKDPGVFEVTLDVADSQNVVSSFTKKITVEEAP